MKFFVDFCIIFTLYTAALIVAFLTPFHSVAVGFFFGTVTMLVMELYSNREKGTDNEL